MKKSKIVFVLLIFGGLLCFFMTHRTKMMAAKAAADKPSTFSQGLSETKVKCDCEANLEDADPNGTNIRSGPERSSPVVKRVKHEMAVVEITGFNSGWFEISKVEDINYDGEAKTLFEGRGWIHSSLLSVDTVGSKPVLFAEPNRRGKVLRNLDHSLSLKLLSCRGQWVRVRFGKLTGWLEEHCANPLTTCS